jgi:hypothetical protein
MVDGVKVRDRDRYVCSGVFHRDSPGAGGGSRLIRQALTGDDRPAHCDVDVEGLGLGNDGKPFDLECRLDLRTDQSGVDVGMEGALREEGGVRRAATATSDDHDEQQRGGDKPGALL